MEKLPRFVDVLDLNLSEDLLPIDRKGIKYRPSFCGKEYGCGHCKEVNRMMKENFYEEESPTIVVIEDIKESVFIACASFDQKTGVCGFSGRKCGQKDEDSNLKIISGYVHGNIIRECVQKSEVSKQDWGKDGFDGFKQQLQQQVLSEISERITL